MKNITEDILREVREVETGELQQDEEVLNEVKNVNSFHQLAPCSVDFNVQNEIARVRRDSCIEIDSEVSLETELSQWFVKHNVTCGAIDGLLDILSRHTKDSSLPKSYKTLLKTPTSYDIIEVGSGYYYHFGVEYKIRRYFQLGLVELSEYKIRLQIGIDGVPISKSSKRHMWPILAKSASIIQNAPFIVGLYYSEMSKPDNVDKFLEPFVSEMFGLIHNGVLLDGICYQVVLECVIADAPARNLLKRTVAYNAYHGCERCITKGSFRGRVIFEDIDAPLRTDHTFINQSDPSHHVGVSSLLRLNIQPVSGFVLDYMHLVCLGVVKKLVLLWKSGTKHNLTHKLSRDMLARISERLLSFRKRFPKEFSRKPRSLYEVEHWKATEFRTFLLYTGPVALKGILPPAKFDHFMLLSVSLRILLSDNREWYVYAKALLVEFVRLTGSLYSRECLIYNVHSLIHIADDSMKFGSLNRISAFPFENFMQKLKRCIKGNVNPLAQVIRREHESDAVGNFNSKEKSVLSFSLKPGDRNYCTRDGKIIALNQILGTKVYGTEFCSYSDFFSKPCKSSMLKIFKLSRFSVPKLYDKSEIVRKVILLETSDNTFVSVPLLDLV